MSSASPVNHLFEYLYGAQFTLSYQHKHTDINVRRGCLKQIKRRLFKTNKLIRHYKALKVLFRKYYDHQYVGETKRKVSERLLGHRSSIKKHANTFIAKHFNLTGHSIDDIRIQPIEHITQRPGETEQDVTIRRLDRERFWMLELATMYPYGLSDRLQHVGNISNSSFQSGINVFNLFNRHTRRKRSHGRRRNSRRTSEFTLDQLRNFSVQRRSWWPASSPYNSL